MGGDPAKEEGERKGEHPPQGERTRGRPLRAPGSGLLQGANLLDPREDGTQCTASIPVG